MLVTRQLLLGFIDDLPNSGIQTYVKFLQLICLAAHVSYESLRNTSSCLTVLFSLLPEFLSLCSVVTGGLVRWRLFSKNILDRENLVEELELALSKLPVVWCNRPSIELLDVLESVCDEWLEGETVKQLVVIHPEIGDRRKAFDLWQENERS